MKTITLKTGLGAIALAGVLMSVPAATFAANASTTTSVNINHNGIIRVINAEVTSISGSIINAMATFKNTIVNFAVNTNASTTIAANNSLTAGTADIRVGDKISVTGALSSIGSTIGLTATKVKDTTSMQELKAKMGTVSNINSSTGSFLLTSDGKVFTVNTNASTTYSLGTTTPTTFANLAANAKVVVTGRLSTDGTTITATRIAAKFEDLKKDMRHNWKNEWKNFLKDHKNEVKKDKETKKVKDNH